MHLCFTSSAKIFSSKAPAVVNVCYQQTNVAMGTGTQPGIDHRHMGVSLTRTSFT